MKVFPGTRVTAPIRRYREITAVLIKHGFGDAVARLHLERYVALGRRLLFAGRPHQGEPLSRAQRVRLMLEELGPTFIKFGQALSTRADLLPADLIAELSRLQDEVPPMRPGQAEATLKAALGQQGAGLFQRFDPTPLAAASIAQVHRATLQTGHEVAVKIRRPGIADLIESDLTILAHLAQLAERYLPDADLYNPTGLVIQFARAIRPEQDLAREGRMIERFARNFATDQTVYFPRVYWQFTTPAVLTLEYVPGLKLSELDRAADRNLDVRTIARRGADAVLKQVLVDGLFHADPHPGNILILPGNIICLLDFGIVGRLDRRLRESAAALLQAIVRHDTERMTDLVLAIAEPQREINRAELRQDLDDMLDAYGDVPLGDLSFGDVLHHAIEAMARHRLKFPADLMLLVKSLVTIEGVGRTLDPSFKMLQHAAPVVERICAEHLGLAAVASRAVDAGREAAAALRSLPVDLADIVRKARGDRLQIQFVHRNLEHFVQEMDRSSNRLSFAVVIAALIVGSSLIVRAGFGPTALGYPALGIAGFLVAAFLGIGLAIGILRSGRL